MIAETSAKAIVLDALCAGIRIDNRGVNLNDFKSTATYPRFRIESVDHFILFPLSSTSIDVRLKDSYAATLEKCRNQL